MTRFRSPIRSRSPHATFVIHSFLSFVICNIDRINLSVAILPMAKTYNWSSTTQGLVQSSFFAGYMTTQILGGRLADSHGGRIVLATGVAVWSGCTAITPISASRLPVLLTARVLLGIGEGVAMPAMNAMVSRWVPDEQRARALSFIYSGMYAGSILGLLLTPALMEVAGWPTVFYVFGGVGIVWVVIFLLTSPAEDYKNGLYRPREGYLRTATEEAAEADSEAALEGSKGSESVDEDSRSVQEPEARQYMQESPSLREIFSRRCVWAIIISHFCCTWGYFVLLAWLPSYLYGRFKLDVTKSALLSAAPWFGMFIFANLGGLIADEMIARGVTVTRTRKTLQSIGFIGPSCFLGGLCFANGPMLAIVLVSAALALASFSQSGVYANHQDIGPQIAGTLLGISNTFASLPGLIGVYVTGVILDATNNNWSAVFVIAISFYFVGLVTYNLFATSERQW